MAGRVSSLSPVCGPDERSFRSIARRYKLLANDVSAFEKSENGAKFVAPSVRFSQDLSFRPVRAFKVEMTSFLNCGCALSPVPTAVPPKFSSLRFSDAFSTVLRERSIDALYESKTWPREIGTASCR